MHIDVNGRVVMAELLDRPVGLGCGQTVQLFVEDGRVLDCQILDDTRMCAVVGEGHLRKARSASPSL
jgi:hypothetical protein